MVVSRSLPPGVPADLLDRVERIKELRERLRKHRADRVEMGEHLAAVRERLPSSVWRRMLEWLGIHHKTAQRCLNDYYDSIGTANPWGRGGAPNTGRKSWDSLSHDYRSPVGEDDDADDYDDPAALESADVDLDDEDGLGDEDEPWERGEAGSGKAVGEKEASAKRVRLDMHDNMDWPGSREADREAPRRSGEGSPAPGRAPAVPAAERRATRQRATQLLLEQEYEAARASIARAQRLIEGGELTAEQARRLAAAIDGVLGGGRAA